MSKVKTSRVTIFTVWYYKSLPDKLNNNAVFFSVCGTKSEAIKRASECDITYWPYSTFIKQKTINATSKDKS